LYLNDNELSGFSIINKKFNIADIASEYWWI
jgi:hypothetical protein